MSGRHIAIAVAAAILSLLSPAGIANADRVTDVADIVDQINGVSGGHTLPFTGAQLRQIDGTIIHCEETQGSTDLVACIDDTAKGPLGDQLDIDPNIVKMLDIYLDIANHDYWGLLEDAGEEVACAAAEILTDGVPVCEGLKALENAAQAVVDSAKAAVAAIEAIGKGLEDIYCWAFGCSSDSGPPQPTAADYLATQAQDGLERRLQGQASWFAFAGSGSGSEVIGRGVKAGYSQVALVAALPGYVQKVYALWDSRIATEILQKVKATQQTWSSKPFLSSRLSDIESQWDDAYTGSALATPHLDYVDHQNRETSGFEQCATAMRLSGGEQVIAWVNEGRAPAGSAFPHAYDQMCASFTGQFEPALRAFLLTRVGAVVNAQCGGGQCSGGVCKSYVCKSDSATAACKINFAQQSPPPNCLTFKPYQGFGSGIQHMDYWICGPPKQQYCKQTPSGPGAKAPAGCVRADQLAGKDAGLSCGPPKLPDNR